MITCIYYKQDDVKPHLILASIEVGMTFKKKIPKQLRPSMPATMSLTFKMTA